MASEALVDKIYQAALDAHLWPEVLGAIAEEVGAAGGVILTRHSDSWTGWKYTERSFSGLDDYILHRSHRSRSTELLMKAQHPGFISTQDVFESERAYLEDAMMKEFGVQRGLHYGVATLIQTPSNEISIFQFQRRIGEPPFGPAERAALDLFRPHLARASFLTARLRMEKVTAVNSALAAVGLPSLVLDPEGKVLAANELMLAGATPLVFLPKGRLSLADPVADAQLEKAILDLRNPAGASVRSIPAPSAPGRGAAVVQVIPTTGWARDFFMGGYGLLVVTPVSGAANPIRPDLLQGLFDLTAKEARIAAAISRGLGLPAIAEMSKVSHETIRTHAKSIYAKTGVKGQSELTALLARLPWAS